jgi:hypothetical protein
MRQFSSLAAFGAILLAGGGAMAKEKSEQPKEHKICKSEAQTSSRIPPPKVCRTQAEWDAQADADARKAGEAVKGARGY